MTEQSIKFKKGTFKTYMESVGYSELTKHQYTLKAKRLSRQLKARQLPQALNQQTIDLFFSQLKGKRNPNDIGFIKALIKAYDPDNQLRLRIPETKGRRKKQEQQQTPKFLEKEQVDYLIQNIKDPQIRLMVRIYAETGLRATELLDWNKKNPNCKIDWDKRIIYGIGKYGKKYAQPFSKKTDKWLRIWMSNNKLCLDRDKPFQFYKTKGGQKGKPYKNQYYELWKRLRKEVKRIIIKDVDNPIGQENIHPHRFRHFVGHFLRTDRGFDLEQIRRYLRHAKLNTTQIYASATDEELYNKMNKEVFSSF